MFVLSIHDILDQMKYQNLFFFRFSTKESAAHAIVAIHNSDVNGHTVKCSWGKESGDPNNLPANSQVQILSFNRYSSLKCIAGFRNFLN